MWIIEQSRPDLNNGRWFQIWSSETADTPDKRGPTYCAEYLKLCVENEPHIRRKCGKQADYRMRYIMV